MTILPSLVQLPVAMNALQLPGEDAGRIIRRPARQVFDGGALLGGLVFIEPWDVILAQLHGAVEGDDVPHVDVDAAGPRPFGDAAQLGLVFRVDVRPEHFFRCVAEELPVAFGGVLVFDFENVEGIGNLGPSR